ncbi:hypothetical protein DY000_02038974 [Brassica cretica]|uniref:Uncharacterized protein n=1 Tax=Brassica cretica TaxID=69181 RepID=A0ABQ7BIM9_BRACR|nr:hypothetical protein DY000_02038974 [Brassica cretica]
MTQKDYKLKLLDLSAVVKLLGEILASPAVGAPRHRQERLSSVDEAIQVEVPIVRRGPTTRSGTRALREGFTKAVQQILDRDGQTGQEQLLIEEMVQLKIQDQAGPTEVQDSTGPIQFRLNQAGQTVNNFNLNFCRSTSLSCSLLFERTPS